MAHLIDILLIAIAALIVFISSKRGIILTVFDLFSGIAAFIIAKILAPYAAEIVYDGIVKEIVIEFLNQKYAAVESSIAASVNEFSSLFAFLPEGITAFIEQSGILDASSVSQAAMESITTVAELESTVVAPVVMAVLNILCFAVIAFVGVIVLRIVGRLLSGLVSKSKITEKLDTALGAVFGILKSVIYVFIIAVVLSVLSFASETVAGYAADSYICSFASKLIGL